MPTKYLLEDYPSCKVYLDTKAFVGIPKSKCAICKGRVMCGISPCPILSSLHVEFACPVEAKAQMHGKAFSMNVGWERFPNDHIGPVVLDNSFDKGQSPSNNIRELLYHKISSSYHSHFDSITKDTLQLFRSISLSQRPVDVDLEFKSRPKETMKFSVVDKPYGKTGELKNLEVFTEPDIPLYIIDIMEHDMNHEQAIAYAYENGASVEYLSKLHSMGYFEKTQKVIPTRWATTTVYSLCSQILIKKVKKLPVIDDYTVFHQKYLENDYLIIAFPKPWEFELIEKWPPGSIWAVGETSPLIVHEHETYNGVSDQAMREGGSYYACRLGVCEMLREKNVQAACMTIYSPGPDTSVPFGLEEIRKGLSEAVPIGRFDNDKDTIDFVCSNFDFNERDLYKNSMMLSQNTLNKWF